MTNITVGMRVRYSDSAKRDIDPQERNDVGRVKNLRTLDEGPEAFIEWASGWTLWEAVESLVPVGNGR